MNREAWCAAKHGISVGHDWAIKHVALHVVLVSTVQQSESDIYICFYIFPSHLGQHRTLSRVPSAIKYVLLDIFMAQLR